MFAVNLGIPIQLIDILEKAGLWHDLGKADPRFQAKLYHPDCPDSSKLLAKSGGHTNEPCGLPEGWRHELQSLSIVLENGLGQDLADKDLLYHLIASHHGWNRNFWPLVRDDNFTSFNVGAYVSSHSYCDDIADRDRFHRLNEKYGYWGLAFLETIIRLADWKSSHQ